MENVEGKARMVVKTDTCVICLHPHHSADRCYDKDNTKRVCGIDGCKSHHHPTLHGSKEPKIASCNVTRMVARRFRQSFISPKITRVYSMKSASEAIKDDEEMQKKWHDYR